jgi:hypothetical protein
MSLSKPQAQDLPEKLEQDMNLTTDTLVYNQTKNLGFPIPKN